MLTVVLEFSRMPDLADFYRQFAAQSQCPPAFGHNLDALWDWLTGGMALPAHIHLCHLAHHPQPALFHDVIGVMTEAAQTLNGQLIVTGGFEVQPCNKTQ